jgi:serine/threonine protein kinase
MPQMINIILAGVVGLVTLIYLAWWWGRFQNGQRANNLAARVAGFDELPQQVMADALEYARLLPATSPDYAAFCRGLTRRVVNDPRVKSHLLRFFSVQRVNAENAASAAHLARLILQTPSHLVKPADIENACGLMDQVSGMGLISEEDLFLRARVARTRADVSPAGIQACLRARTLTENTPEHAPLTRFLFDYFSTVWETPDAPEKSDPEFASQAASIFTVMANMPPANLIYRRRAIQATYESGNYRTCFEQCDRARDEFGAPAISGEMWIIWGQSVVQLESGDWSAYAQHHFTGLPQDVTWQRLMEVMDRAASLKSEDSAIQAGRIWTYVGAKVPVKRAPGVYESALQYHLSILPAMQNLTRTYFQEREWAKLETAARFLLTFEPEPEAAQTRRWLAEALLEGKLRPDQRLFERVFDETESYPALNEYLATVYLEQKKWDEKELHRLEALLGSPIPASFTKKKVQELRERYALACLASDFKPDSLRGLVVAYLQDGGGSTELRRWAAEQQVGGDALQRGVLEKLIEQRPVERKHILSLGGIYAIEHPTIDEMNHLAEAAELMWADRSVFDLEDCRLGVTIHSQADLTPSSLHKMLQGLVTHRPDGWRPAAIGLLTEAIHRRQADITLLTQCVERLFRADDRDAEHVWALELLSEKRDEPIQDGLRLLSLYDAGLVKPGEAATQSTVLAEALAEKLAKRCPELGPAQRQGLFDPLFNRQRNLPAAKQSDWAIDFLIFGADADLLGKSGAVQKFINDLANHLLGKGNKVAIGLFRWLYGQSGRSVPDAAVLFQAASRLDGLDQKEIYWLQIARQATKNVETRSAAEEFLLQVLQDTQKWEREYLETAVDLLDGKHRLALAPVFVQRAQFGRDHHLDQKILELLDENPSLASGDATLLLALAERREKKRNSEGALEALYMVEDTVGGSEELARHILILLPNSSGRAAQSGRVAEYLKRYRNSYDLLAQMVALARDPAKPLPFESAFTIVDRWAELALKQPSGEAYAADASFIALTKCEVYDLYHTQISQEEANLILRSIARQSRQALSSEARQRIERIGDEVLFSSGQAAETRLTVAEILYGLGNLAGAVWHFERLYEMDSYRQNAAESLERIARQLENPRRELPALLAAYRCVAQSAQRSGQLDVAEAAARKAKAILVDEAALEELSGEDQRRVAQQSDELLRIYQTILEAKVEKGAELDVNQRRDLADVLRLRGLWHYAGKYYSELALALQKKADRQGALEAAEQVFDCYYKAGKSWWAPAAGYLLKILWGRDTVPPKDYVERFNKQEMELLESIAVLYHSLFVDPSLKLDPARRATYKRSANQLYDSFPFQYLQDHEYIQRLQYDLSLMPPTIVEPFELVPHISRHGRSETWTGLRYEKMDRLGSGEFADVFKVKDLQTGKVYAMKLITAAKGREKKAVERFEREGRWLRELDHPNIVKCHDIGVQEERQYIIMDLVEGNTLDKLITARRLEISLQTRLQIFLKICAAVEYLHSQGLLHRDLHPNNVLVGGEGYSEVKLTDFGLATIIDREGVGKSSRIHGRENYTSPEVYDGKGETSASDIFSLGALLCFILTGYPRPDAALQRELKSKAFFNLGEVVERALANNPQGRYQRVTELIADVRRRVDVPFDFGAIIQNVAPGRFQQLFELKEPLGQGQSGPVYLGLDLRLPEKPEVAIKEIESQQVRGSLERRAEHFFRVRDLSHPNIVHLHGFYRVDSKLYIVMERVNGASLATLIEQNEQGRKRFRPAEVLRISQDLASAVAYIHEQDIVHGCVLPTNIMIEATNGQARLSDFTASVLFDRDHWHKSAMLRQYDYYLAPEVRGDGQISPASDVYSLGCLLAHLVSSQRGVMTENELYAAMEESRLWSEGQMDALIKIILNSTALAPERREFKDGKTLLTALQAIK